MPTHSPKLFVSYFNLRILDLQNTFSIYRYTCAHTTVLNLILTTLVRQLAKTKLLRYQTSLKPLIISKTIKDLSDKKCNLLTQYLFC